MGEYHVTCGVSKKILRLKEEDDIMKAIRDSFNISSEEFIIQMWDNAWEDWTDICASDLPSRAKLKVEFQPTNTGAESITAADIAHSITAADTADSTPATGVVAIDDTSVSRITGKEAKFLKYITPTLMDALRSGEKLEKGHRTQILNILYDEMCKKTLHPTKDDYRSMAEKLVQEFPSLASGIGFMDAVSLWRSSLSEKFRFQRKSLKRKWNGSIEKRPERNTKKSGGIQNTWGIPISNFLPVPAEGETASSLEAHIKWMKAEHSKLRQDKNAIRTRLEVTFAERRRLIVTEGASIEKIKEIFPCLFEEHQFLAEFNRLVSADVEKTFVNNLQIYGPSVIKLTLQSQLGRSFTAALAETTEKENLAAEAVPILLTVLAKENISSLMRPCTEEAVSTYPMIVYKECNVMKIKECEIFCGRVKICKCLDVTRAMILIIATHYIFGIQYPKEASNTLKLIQHLLCGITDTAKKTKRFLRIVNMICNVK